MVESPLGLPWTSRRRKSQLLPSLNLDELDESEVNESADKTVSEAKSYGEESENCAEAIVEREKNKETREEERDKENEEEKDGEGTIIQEEAERDDMEKSASSCVLSVTRNVSQLSRG